MAPIYQRGSPTGLDGGPKNALRGVLRVSTAYSRFSRPVNQEWRLLATFNGQPTQPNIQRSREPLTSFANGRNFRCAFRLVGSRSRAAETINRSASPRIHQLMNPIKARPPAGSCRRCSTEVRNTSAVDIISKAAPGGRLSGRRRGRQLRLPSSTAAGRAA